MFLAAVAAVLCLAIPASAMAANELHDHQLVQPRQVGQDEQARRRSAATFGFSVTRPRGQAPATRSTPSRSTSPASASTRRDFQTCSAAAIEQAQSDTGLQVVGAGRHRLREQHRRQRGQPRRRLDPLLPVDQALQLGQATRSPCSSRATRTRRKSCPIAVATAIPVKITRGAAGDSLSFSIPSNLKNPIPTLRNALVETKLTLAKKTVRKHGRTVGYFETIGGCKGGKRAITVTFDNEGANDAKRSTFARCS